MQAVLWRWVRFVSGQKHSTNNYCHSRIQKAYCLRTANSVNVIPSESAEKSLGSPSSPQIKRREWCWKISDSKHGGESRSSSPQSIMLEYYQINEFTVWVLAADGRTLVGYREPRESQIYFQSLFVSFLLPGAGRQITHLWFFTCKRSPVIFQPVRLDSAS